MATRALTEKEMQLETYILCTLLFTTVKWKLCRFLLLNETFCCLLLLNGNLVVLTAKSEKRKILKRDHLVPRARDSSFAPRINTLRRLKESSAQWTRVVNGKDKLTIFI